MITDIGYNKIHLLAECFIVLLLSIVIGLVAYDVFKPPLVSKDTIDELKKSTASIESYTKELQISATLSRQQIAEDDTNSQQEKIERNTSYNDLLSRYGINDEYKNEIHSPPITYCIDDGLCK